ncbi:MULTISPECIES: GNAT family N-acetyltransferase [Amycolatopsis]|uniref:L-amino acid N-acyltransferase YncA n=2 Tax=Amycolatopsis TaxID=1813 RepID=A0A1I3KZN5_9PSEU|nr:GNAT family N-acetyltransferase [Amycolatopsis sacchari]SFI77788.1 L-amino acid N-acyltransferase YncA [Amycolatopsis sacchari]
MHGNEPEPPTGFRRSLRLRDGREVVIAPLTAGDAEELGDALRHADSETLYRRFCGTPPKVTPELLRYLTELDYVRRFALVARDPAGKGVAVARYEATGAPGVAEVAVVVAPGWRGNGLASALLRMLAEAAQARGFTGFTALYLADNRPVAELLASVHGARVISDGIAEATARLTSPPG